MSEQELDQTVAEVPASTGAGAAAGGDRQSAQNPDDNPAFRQLKSTLDKRIAALEKESQLARAQAEAERQQRLQLEQQWHATQLQGMTEVEQALYKAQIAEQRAAQREQEVLRKEQALQRERDLDALAQELGVDREAINDATDPMDAAIKAAKWLKNHSEARVQEQNRATVERRMANQVDIGGGTPTIAGNDGDLQRKYDNAMKDFDTSRAIDIMHEALVTGVKLKL